MPYNGAGSFSLYSPGNPVVTGTVISSTWANNTLSDMATGLSTAVTKDGQQTITANIPMSGYKLTGLGAGTANGDSLRYQQGIPNVYWYGAVGDGTTNDRAAIVSAGTAGYLIFPKGSFAVASNLTITGNCVFQPGAILKPGAGVTITITGNVNAGAYQIVDISAGGHVSMVSSKTEVGYPEWWAVTGGDVAFSAGNATTNKSLIDEMITYGPYEIAWTKPGFYSTTGHVMSVSHKFTGLGKSSTNGIYGSGILFTDNAHMVSQGATLAGKKYVFQNGASGAIPDFEDISVFGSSADCIALGILPSSLAALEWQCNARNCHLEGYIGQHLGWANGNHWDQCTFFGSFAAVAHTVWDDSSGSTTAYGYIQKQLYSNCLHSQTQVASGQIIYQDRTGSGTPTSFAITDNTWEACDFEYGYNGMVLKGFNQVFQTPHIENLRGSTWVSGESTTYTSFWKNVGIFKGAGTLDPGTGFAALGALFANLGTNSSLAPFVGASTLNFSGCTTVPTSTVNWSVDENRVVVLNVRGVAGTSNSTSKTLSALPSYLWPARDKIGTFLASDSGAAYVVAQMKLPSATGVLTFYATANGGNWTSSGTATVNDLTFSYSLA